MNSHTQHTLASVGYIGIETESARYASVIAYALICEGISYRYQYNADTCSAHKILIDRAAPVLLVASAMTKARATVRPESPARMHIITEAQA